MKLDLKDKKILFELDKNSRISLSDLGRKVRLSKEVVFHRINNLVERGFILRFQTVISTYRLGYQSYKIYFKLQNMTQEIRKQIQEFFMKHSLVYWIGNCQGRWDLIIASWSRNIKDFGDLEDEILNKFSNYILEKEVTISRKSVQYNRRWFYHDKLEPVEMSYGEDLEEIKLDEVDFEILKNIANNARIKITELAKKLKVSVTVVRYRLKQLEKNKVIIGYKYALNPRLLNYETCKSFVFLKNITAEKKKSLINYCKLNPNIINTVQTIGPWDLEIELEVENFEQYYQIMNEIQEKFNEIIKSYESVLFSSEPKQSFVPGAY
ncbi:MAG: Lrp/AsnC family transcriptional regulator [Nanoarchaeota archaeon]|nr:Lrp/AsnC family transcriptional regulator [Nanoarchaeota archaeon]